VRPAQIDTLVAMFGEVLKELARRGTDDGDPWVAHTEWSFCSKRVACELARSGAIEGARRLDTREEKSATKGGRGVVYIARRSALEKYVAKSSTPVVVKVEAAPISGVAGVLAEIGLEAIGANDAPRRAGRGRR
jgi:hypothetical protein